jgi:hypothetical protein
VDDERIKALTAEVLQALHAPGSEGLASPGLEARVAALEAVVRALGRPAGPAVAVRSTAVVLPLVHPSLELLGPEPEAAGRCVMEPDRPCVQSGMCRTLGH